jgi:hypothetical protein
MVGNALLDADDENQHPKINPERGFSCLGHPGPIAATWLSEFQTTKN